jgi:glycosyltransferase involved in cell wall biosynthesis
MTRSLLVTHSQIWPIRSGSGQRRQNAIDALAALGPVDVLFVGEIRDAAAINPPPGSFVERVLCWPSTRTRASRIRLARWILWPSKPHEFLQWKRPILPSPVSDTSYDIVWHCRALGHDLAPPIKAGIRIVDLDDLEDHKIRSMLLNEEITLRRRLFLRRNLRGWQRNQRRLANRTDVIVLCSEIDRVRLGGNVAVVPNSVRDPGARSRAADRRTILLVGFFWYTPNTDAAEFFITSVLPLLQRRVPDVEVRLVGEPSDRVRSLASDHVQVVGMVEDLGPEYDAAMIAVAPVRVGSGTRVKIIDAFAQRVPVVATTLAAEGLDVRNGVHCLLADDAQGFADACADLLENASLRDRLGAAGRALYEANFSPTAVTQGVLNAIALARHGNTNSASGEC